MAAVEYLDDTPYDDTRRQRNPSIVSGSVEAPLYPTVDSSKLSAFRQAADQARYYEDQTDTNVLADPRYEHFFRTGEYKPSNSAFPDNEIGGANFGQGRAAIDAISQAQSGASRDRYGLNPPPFQFNDPYTKQLEDVIRQQMGNLAQPQSNPMLERVLSFLSDRFNTLSQSPGYTPDDIALIQTQMREPIEQDRAASQQRALQRAATAGFLPTSGITQLTGAPNGGVETIDTAYDRMRAAANRDVAINAINKRREDLNQAVSLGQLAGVQIPQIQRQEDQQRRQELLALSSLLYDLPARAQQQALAVLNGTEGPRDLFAQSLQSQQLAQQQEQMNMQRFFQLAQALAGLDF